MADEREQSAAVALAAAARSLEPNLADEKVVKEVRFNAKNQRDCGAASSVGAATVAISLLPGGSRWPWTFSTSCFSPRWL